MPYWFTMRSARDAEAVVDPGVECSRGSSRARPLKPPVSIMRVPAGSARRSAALLERLEPVHEREGRAAQQQLRGARRLRDGREQRVGSEALPRARRSRCPVRRAARCIAPNMCESEESGASAGEGASTSIGSRSPGREVGQDEALEARRERGLVELERVELSSPRRASEVPLVRKTWSCARREAAQRKLLEGARRDGRDVAPGRDASRVSPRAPRRSGRTGRSPRTGRRRARARGARSARRRGAFGSSPHPRQQLALDGAAVRHGGTRPASRAPRAARRGRSRAVGSPRSRARRRRRGW